MDVVVPCVTDPILLVVRAECGEKRTFLRYAEFSREVYENCNWPVCRVRIFFFAKEKTFSRNVTEVIRGGGSFLPVIIKVLSSIEEGERNGKAHIMTPPKIAIKM